MAATLEQPLHVNRADGLGEHIPGTSGRAPSIFVSHGAGPLAVVRAPHQIPLCDLSEATSWTLNGGLKAIILITAHWVTDQPHICASSRPKLIHEFDESFGPLPKEVYEIEYAAKGEPELAKRVKEALDLVGFEAVLDENVGWDQGTYTPLILMRPQADIPVVAVSVPGGGEDTKAALRLGKALESFRDEGVAILGSGSSYHNFDAVIQQIMNPDAEQKDLNNRNFEDALEKVATLEKEEERLEAMGKWRQTFPGADDVQVPGKSEHFMPFPVTLGAAGGDKGYKLGEWNLFGTIHSSFIWW